VKKRKAPARTRSGTVAIVGRPNVGKSTFLNAALGVPLAIVSKTPQTTREALLGVVRREIDEGEVAEIRLLDTPGLHKGERAIDRFMNRQARTAVEGADVVVFFTDLPRKEMPLTPHTGDLVLLRDVGAGAKTVLVVNKVDLVKDKSRLLPLLEALAKVRDFEAVVPISALREDGVERVLTEIGKLLPEGPLTFGEDDLTDRPTRFFAREYVREQVLHATREEVPHATAVTIDTFEERPKGFRIAATVHVERPGHKKILVGAGGEMLKRIGTAARKRIEELTGTKVHLELFVRVTPKWRDTPGLVQEMMTDEAAPAARRLEEEADGEEQ
jgi:GTP-binding protein Era